jgi:DNA-binding transcriptional LysR family regulator
MDWEKLKIFHAVAEAASFTRAAERLNLSQSALSRQIKALENQLNVALFTRHARGLVLTQEGEQLFETARKVVRAIEEAEHGLQESKAEARGRLRVTTTVAFGTFWLTPHLREFIRAFPDINVELFLTDKDLDLAAGEAEIAIRFHPPAQAELIQKPLVSIHQHICASAKYLNQRGSPEKVADLDQHDIVVYGPAEQSPHLDVDWILKVGRPKRPRTPKLQINSHLGVLKAVQAGIGLGTVPDYLAAAHPDLVRVLGEVAGPAYKAYFVYPGELKRSRRVNEFRDFLVKKIEKESAQF